MKKFYLFFLFAVIAQFSAKANVQIFTVSGTVYENPNVNPVPGHLVTIEIPASNVFDGYFNEVFTNDAGEYLDEVEVPEALMQAEVLISTIDCNGYLMTEMYPFYQGLLSITCDFIICDEPFPDCWAMWDYQPSPNDPFTIMFFDASFFAGEELEWFWQFGDGSGSDEQNPVHTFGGAGIYPVCLTITTPDCEDTFCMDVNVEFIPPGCQAFFEWIPMEEQTIHFIDMSDSPPTEWLWDFGDGTFSDEPAPIHFYQQPGDYVVCLTIFDEQTNCEDTFCQDIWVEGGGGGDCQAYYTWWPMDDLTVEFLDLSNFEPGEWVWEFGDGQMSWDPNPVHNYYQPGVYPVCLTVYGENCVDVYCEEVIVDSPPNPCDVQFWWNHLDNFQVQFNNESIPGTESVFTWDFGDSNTSNELSPLHQYDEQGVYQVCLHMYNPIMNCENTLCQEVWVGNNFECQAAFDWVPLGDSAYVVQFYDASIGPDDLNYFWEFGDGETSEEQDPIHLYQEVGFFEVCLTITSPDCQDVFCNEVYVEGYPWDCYAEFDWQLDADMNVQFFDWSYPTPEEWLWDFGDGETSTEQNPNHQYFEPGNYEVCLHIYNSFAGCDEEVCNVVEVEILGGLNASFGYMQDSTNFFTIYFFDTSIGNPVDWMWEFGDGTMSNEQNPVHSFNGPGTYVVCLTIMDAAGQASTYCEEIILDGSYISGIDEPKNELILSRVFPNPSSNFVNLEFNSPTDAQIELVLINLQGKEIQRSSRSLVNGDNQLRVDVSSLPEGVYLLRVQSGNTLSTTKIKVSK